MAPRDRPPGPDWHSLSAYRDIKSRSRTISSGNRDHIFILDRAPSIYEESDYEDDPVPNKAPIGEELRREATPTSGSSAVLALRPTQCNLALLATPRKGLLGFQESNTSINSTISRDSTAGEHARHGQLLCEYGKKLGSQRLPETGRNRVVDLSLDDRDDIYNLRTREQQLKGQVNESSYAVQDFEREVARYWDLRQAVEKLGTRKRKTELYEEPMRRAQAKYLRAQRRQAFREVERSLDKSNSQLRLLASRIEET